MSDPTFRIARYRLDGRIHFGRLVADGFARWSAAPWDGGHETGVHDPASAANLLSPVDPGKIVCVGLNYREHVAESLSVAPGSDVPREPVLFLKPPSSVIAGGQPIRYPAGVTRLDPEAELAVVIGRRTRHVAVERAMESVAGLTCMNDVSARNFQKQDVQWTRGKGFDTFAPLGPCIAIGLAPESRRVECRVNGRLRQRGNTADLLFPVPFLIHFISHVMTLEPGDVIATGTPSGIAPVEIGDRIEVEIDGVGVLENTVEREE